MMARDMEKKNISDYRWTKENCKMFSVKIRYDSGIPEALEKVKKNGLSGNSYIVEALKKQLIADGYMSQGNK